VGEPEPIGAAHGIGFASRLRSTRRSRGLTQKDLAEQFDVAQQTVAAWERGGRPDPSLFAKVTRFLQLRNEDELVRLLEVDESRSRVRSLLGDPTTDLSGLTPRAALDMLTRVFLTRQSLGDGLSEIELAIFQALISHYTELASTRKRSSSDTRH
jgi:transcriptional regulator with XRE-family HTH domain